MHASMPHATSVSVGLRHLPRDARVDVLRGIALIMIFIDHLPGNPLSLVTLHSFGFCDAAELFVLLAGFSSMAAYGGSFDRDGVLIGLRRVFLRVLRLYLFQAALLLVVFVGAWLRDFAIEPEGIVPYLGAGLNGLRNGLTLRAQPPGLNILPLYIIPASARWSRCWSPVRCGSGSISIPRSISPTGQTAAAGISIRSPGSFCS
jgi:hypothetical protein